jgi:GNAT superfamily N-acetyltransferase
MNDDAPVVLTIRPAEAADAAALASLMGELGYETRTSEMEMRLEFILGDPRYQTFVAVSDGKIRGMIGSFCHYSYEHNDPSGRILALVVSKTVRGRGVGRQLISAAENDFAQRNVRRLAVYTRLTRQEAHQFYEKLGYERNGLRFVKDLAVNAD